MRNPAQPSAPVPKVHTFKQSVSETPDERENTQKPLSFIQLATADPAPMTTARYAILHPSVSLVTFIVERMEEDVIIAVVLEPCADFNAAVTKNAIVSA